MAATKARRSKKRFLDLPDPDSLSSPFRPAPEPDRVVMFAGQSTTLDKIKGTLGMLKYYRSFLADGRYRECRDLQAGWLLVTLTQEQTRARLGWLVNVAINRKAGLSEGRLDSDLRKDCELLNHIVHRNNPSVLVHNWYSNLREFRTRRIQKRFGPLLAKFTRDRNADYLDD